MDLTYSIKDLNQLELQVNRSIKNLEDNGTILSGQHSLLIILKLVQENRQLREELVNKYLSSEPH